MDDPTPKTGADVPDQDSPRFEPGDRRLSPGATAFLGLGLSIGLCFAVMAGAGVLLDAWLHSSPVCLLVGLALGAVLAVLMAVSTIRKYL